MKSLRILLFSIVLGSGTGSAMSQDNLVGEIFGRILKDALSGNPTGQNNRNQEAVDENNATAYTQVLPPSDRHTLSDQMVHYLIADFVANTNSQSTTRAPCSNFFDVPAVKVVDRRVRGDMASVQVHLTARPKTNVEPFFILMCFGVNTTRPWRAGGTNIMQGVYDFELWDDGWKITPRRPR
ncbi:MAG: hypothetical protein ABIK36_07690 [Pseudomonadota bacterium]